MKELYILNNAIMVLKNECASHEECDGCPLRGERTPFSYECILGNENIPEDWKFVSEEMEEE